MGPARRRPSPARLWLYNNEISELAGFDGPSSLEEVFFDEKQITLLAPLVEDAGIDDGDHEVRPLTTPAARTPPS